ncbi:MAG TPA: hypothetical protein VG870_13075 [Chitinophagaceae bacterium]|nr:hypothetical protein [Chitinophagaceae bacterium]
MNNTNRDLLVLLKDHSLSDHAIEQQVEYLHLILQHTESPEQFCTAHELVERNRITNKPRRILRAIRETELRPFCFLINRN